ncbi:syndecan-4 isoform X1 [Maylandia zebra]|uniref:syndecan-4 isoform X1 n=1 Tax=Maylandia zebra TaxID=106582 RepID=UPI000E423733|nr:syndecan-4-like isoform X1 [Astatotilapia calliptera]
MLTLCLVLMLSTASVFSESQVRETETWMPMKSSQTAGVSTRGGDLEASGDAPIGSDFGFTDDDADNYTYDDEDYNDFSGSGDADTPMSPDETTTVKLDIIDNKIPEPERPVRPTVNERDIVEKNEIPVLGNDDRREDNLSNVLMSHTGNESITSKTEFLAALTATLAVSLVLAVLLILFLIYRMKKKDEGSYDLSKKPIYKKAPTTEIYA